MNLSNIKIRKSNTNEPIPYPLLLLSDDTTEAIDKNLHNGDLYFAEHNHLLIAAFILKAINRESIEIKNIAVVEEFQGKGIGSVLLAYIIKSARDSGYQTLLVGTCDQCAKEIEFYRKSGFQISGIRKNFFIENYNKPIYENGIQIKDMVLLTMHLDVAH